jgi:hypothetical protein
MERGDFYASTGVEISDYEATATSIRISVRPTAFSKYRIKFIGRGGRMLSEQTEPSASYTVKGDEGYVRVRVVESNGRMAWMQPVVVPAPRSMK